jgi:PIN domain nuclease of toxin-antitoxin system
MKILLDTHVFLWAVSDDPRLSPAARALILNAEEVHVSAASLWEIAIKTGLGKLEADVDELVQTVHLSGFQELPVTMAHTAELSRLPLLSGHKDPFDRLLVAQSMSEPLILLTADSKIEAYGGLVRMV